MGLPSKSSFTNTNITNNSNAGTNTKKQLRARQDSSLTEDMAYDDASTGVSTSSSPSKRWVPKGSSLKPFRKPGRLFSGLSTKTKKLPSSLDQSGRTASLTVATPSLATSSTGDLAALSSAVAASLTAATPKRTPLKLFLATPNPSTGDLVALSSVVAAPEAVKKTSVNSTNQPSIDIQTVAFTQTAPLDSKTTLSKLSDIENPPTSDLAQLAAIRAKEYIDECLLDHTIDRTTWGNISQYSKSDFLIGKYLGRGTFSDAFEVNITVTAAEETKMKQEGMTDKYITSYRSKTYAMKNLRPKLRSDLTQYIDSVEDLVHETAMLASLDHPNIVKLHGRMNTTSFSNSINDGYFILLDRLQDTLDERILSWRKIIEGSSSTSSYKPSFSKKTTKNLIVCQLKAAYGIADALSYLHKKHIVFLDLKPTNVGFDHMGVVKLFDFGFAIDVSTSSNNAQSKIGLASTLSEDQIDGSHRSYYQETHLQYETCGTPRYMAPEVGLELGYGVSADVHSFGILLWEICSLKKPFGNVKSGDELHKKVFEKGVRPKVNKSWPPVLKDTLISCWSPYAGDRPTMDFVKMILKAFVKGM